MSQRLISLNPDLKKLRDMGYEVAIRNGYLVITNIPYVNAKGEILYGTLVSVTLELSGDRTVKPVQHTVYFSGEYPCDQHGKEIQRIRHDSTSRDLGNGLKIDHMFSAKPPDGYNDYYHKMTNYVAILSGPAQQIDPSVTAKTFLPVVDEDDPVFNYIDTASSRADIAELSKKLEINRIGIVGLGGTGSYILDFVAKTPVREIHLFDADRFMQHNAFRSPGAPSLDDLQQMRLKVRYWAQTYLKMRKNIIAHEELVTSENSAQLKEMDFVFLCIDDNNAKKHIVALLRDASIPFIDVGMGVHSADGSLGGVLRVTAVTAEKHDHIQRCIPLSDIPADDDYNNNVQIAELNALNAALAVVKWKKLYGFYRDLEHEYHATYTTDGNMIINEETA